MKVIKVCFKQAVLMAKSGHHGAVLAILKMYDPLITKYSDVRGRYSEDCKQYILLQIIKDLHTFNFR